MPALKGFHKLLDAYGLPEIFGIKNGFWNVILCFLADDF